MFYARYFLILSILTSWTNLKANVNSQTELKRLFIAFDRDSDKKLTADDKISSYADFKLKIPPYIEARGLYQLSNLAQELKFTEQTGFRLKKEYIYENPVERISRLIRDRYWNGLTRRIDKLTISKVIEDPKVDNEKSFLYIPYNDEISFRHFRGLKNKNIIVRKLPPVIEKGFIASLKKEQGLLLLALQNDKGVPYVVPGGRFNEMYGWDSYFHLLGVLADNRVDLAKGMLDNFIYEIENYGMILNANRTYYLTRSQPPFFTSMLREYINVSSPGKEWLARAIRAAIKEYKKTWMGKQRLTDTGLSRYAGFDDGIPPEVEKGHFDFILNPYAKKHRITTSELEKRFNNGKIKDNDLKEFFHQDRAMRESGHDSTYRWRVGDEDRAADFVTIDLNSLLYKYELDIAWLIKNFFKGKFEGYNSDFFVKSAFKRKDLIRKYLWDSRISMFHDFNWVLNRRSSYVSATVFYPLWASAGHDERFKILSQKEADKFISKALSELEQKGGLSATALSSHKNVREKK